jgi:phosphate transport system protein
MSQPEESMSAASNQPIGEAEPLLDLTLKGCEEARAAAAAARQMLTSSSPEHLERVRACEEALDTLDRQINEGVTRAIAHGTSGVESRELLACLKCIVELERIGDLLLSFADRAAVVQGRLNADDVHELVVMAGVAETMMGDSEKSLRQRDVKLALSVWRSDAEMDRLRNLVFMRHIENRENQLRQESFHVVFMTQSLERVGDHAKNFAEEVVHLVTGRSVRHLLRAEDKPDEVRFLDWMRQREARR